LIALVRNYYRADRDFDIRRENNRLENSPEWARFQTRWEQEFEKMDQWDAFVDDVGAAFPRFMVSNITSTCDASFRCAVYSRAVNEPPPSRWVVVGCVSILAPVYAVYGVQFRIQDKRRITDQLFLEALPPEMQAPAEVIASKLEATFGVTALPHELARTPIPLIVEFKEPPHSTLFDALFISQPDSVP
jgi:hypothetical protein